MSKTAIIILVVGILILGGIGATIFVLNQPQDTRSRASNPTPAPVIPTTTTAPSISPSPSTLVTPTGGIGGGSAQQSTCATPTSAQNVLVEYPGCEGDNCLFTQASCTWDPNNDATTYNLTVTEVETGSVVRNESIPNSTTKVLFPVTQGRTYKCDISVANSCGNVSAVSSDQLLCEADAIIPTATPTVATTPAPTASATATIAPTTAPTVVPTITPTPPIVGGLTPTLSVFGVVLILIIGGIVFLAL